MILAMLADGFDFNTRVIHMHVDDLTHAESLIQPPANGNCLNWILGHVISSRHIVLSMVGGDPVWDETQRAHYKRESALITGDGPGVLPLDQLLRDLDESGARLVAAIRALPPEAAERIIEGFSEPLGNELLFLYWHEGYHIGQMDFSRKFAGRTNKLI